VDEILEEKVEKKKDIDYDDNPDKALEEIGASLA